MGPIVANRRSRIYAWPDAEAKILWRRKIGWCFRAARPQNRRDTGRLTIVLDEYGPEIGGSRQPSSMTLMSINIPPVDEDPSDADVHFLEDHINQYNVETTKIGDGRIISFLFRNSVQTSSPASMDGPGVEPVKSVTCGFAKTSASAAMAKLS